MQEEGLLTLKDDVIKDRFVLDSMEIIVIDGSRLGSSDGVIFAKLVSEGANYVLRALTDEQYFKAAQKYEMLNKLFSE